MGKKNIALIGSNGQLGSDIMKIFSADETFVISPLTHADIEISNAENIKNTFDKIQPNIIINTAAYNRVDDIEKNCEKAMLVNGIANKYLADYCKKSDIVFVYISTDYVFGSDINRKTPYIESDLPGPVNAYGISKLAGEYFTQYSCPRHFIIRTSGLFGKTGSTTKGGNFVESMLNIAKEKHNVRVVNDQILTPTHTLDLAKQILLLIKSNHYGIYHATAEGQCSWYEFAKAIFEFKKIDVRVESILSSEFNSKAERPKYSVLENKKLKELNLNTMKPWIEGLHEYFTL